MLRLGILDFDSSHSIEFTRRFNQTHVPADQFVEGARVVMGHAGDSEMAPERIPGFRDAVVDCGVRLVEEPGDMLGHVDGVLVLSLCGSAHLERARPFLEAGLPVYVDKPFACSWSDARELVELAVQNRTLVFGTSALRYAEELLDFQRNTALSGRLHGTVVYGPAKRAAGNPGLFHYGIHATEMLFALMGPGCRELTATSSEHSDVVTGVWDDGRLGVLRGARAGASRYGFVAFCAQGVIHQDVSTRYAYRNLCREIVTSFQSGQPAVDPHLTLELTRFVLAALRSEEQRGQVVALAEIE